MKKCLLVLGFCWLALASYAQEETINFQDGFQLQIERVDSEMMIDGLLEESTWKKADVAKDFWEKFPRAEQRAHLQTEVRMAYDDTYLYVGAILYDSTNHIIQTLKRDVNYWNSDGFGVVLDPVNENTYGFMFGVSPAGVQMEGLLSPGGEDLNEDWDNKWISAVKNQSDRWLVEMAIPFKTLRYEEGKTTWGLNFIRNDAKHNQYHTWTNIPQQFNGIDLGYTGALKWDKAPVKAKGNVAIIPYVTGSVLRDFEEKTPTEWDGNAGLDAKIAVTSSLNLDLTVNPDFSQIEVDRQVTNLTRFNIFLPERRTFFLENSDVFSSFGFPGARPFFSRTIGLDEDGGTVPILLGARLSGNLDKNWRIGLMNMTTQKSGEQAGQNYSAAAFQRRVFARSAIKGLLVNRQSLDGLEFQDDDYGRNASLAFEYTSKDGGEFAWVEYNQSMQPEVSTDAFFYKVGFGLNRRNIDFFIDYIEMGDNYTADMGFLRRINNYDAERDTVIKLGFSHIFAPININLFPKDVNSFINRHSIQLESFIAWDYKRKYNEHNTDLGYRIRFKNSSNARFTVGRNFVNLLFPFSFVDGEPLPAGKYNFWGAAIGYESDERKAFSFETDIFYGGFYNGDRFSATLELNYRRQPWGNFGLEFEFNDLKFPEPYGEATLLAISPRIEVNFNRNIFWTTFLQYNTQAENFNINSRLQWRFAPMSDFFLVYTDNYLVESDPMSSRFRIQQFGPKNRALVFKVNYWLAL